MGRAGFGGGPAGLSWLRGLRCVIVLVEAVGIKGAFGVPCGERASSPLDTPRLDQGRTQLRGSRGDE